MNTPWEIECVNCGARAPVYAADLDAADLIWTQLGWLLGPRGPFTSTLCPPCASTAPPELRRLLAGL